MVTLSARERAVLGFLEAYHAAHGCPPTVREIGAGCGIPSTRSVSDYLKGLERAGYVRRRRSRSRGIELVRGRPRDDGGVPVLGVIAAGRPLAAEADGAESLPVDPGALFGERDCFALRVKGDSMTGRHIVEGDWVLVRPQPMATPGDIVAAEVDGEVTLKIYRRDGERVVLVAANPDYPPLVLDGHGGPVRILGVMVGLVRGAGV